MPPTSPEPRTRRRNLATWVAAGALLLASSSACAEDECSPGESRCDGEGIATCGSPGDVSGQRSFSGLAAGCGRDRCLDVVEGGLRVAVCSTSGVKDARCPPGARGPICVDAQTRLTCQLGYASGQTTCAACVTIPASTSEPAALVCAAETAPNPACSGDVVRACADAVVVECLRGWVTSRTPCEGDSPACVAGSGAYSGSVHCARTEACTERDTVRCEDGGVRGCIAGKVVRTTCAADERCESALGGARCRRRCSAVRDGVCLDPP